ncbi:MFS general substrate transporter [Decorospora gaudefroyi]|uniref:MFS general substrate transporter n=1 Tax=Decorospora gaudefroyi TaxID=184978 RepID=A0A6A5JXF8_9PLEO|nr:MFS general substrate transporter [Decorospora gaudefroyi]
MLKNAAEVSGEGEEVVRPRASGPRAEEIGHAGHGDAEVRAEPRAKKRRFGLGRKKQSYSHAHFKVYKRRWIVMGQLVLLNIVVSWDWLTFAPISTSSAIYFDVPESSINWLSTAFLFSFAATCPLTIYLLHRGPKDSIIAASILLLVGNWIRYAGTKANGGIFGVVMFGQILTGLAQPFVLAAPTRYSDMWFTERGRIGATALASLANPLGAALASLINPFLGSVPTTVLIVSIIATVACIPSLFIPARPPTPPSASSAISKTPVLASIKHILRSPSFYLISLTFSTYVGFFNAFSSLLNQILYPYGYSEDEAGICGAVLIVVGLLACAITSPILDRTHAYLLGIKVLCPLVAVSYLALIFAPQTRTIVAPYLLSAVLGASSFSLLPITLEYLVEITFPASPEVSSTICWVSGQILGGVFIVVMNALKDSRPVDLESVREAGRGSGVGDKPPGHMFSALVFQAVVSLAVLPLPLVLGIKKLGLRTTEGRLMKDEDGESVVESVEGEGDSGDTEQ